MMIPNRFLFPSLLLLSNFLCFGFGYKCESDRIQCESNPNCIQIRYICDGDNDCGDNSDEAFCAERSATGCSTRGEAKCTRNGVTNCVSMSEYCRRDDPPCTGIVDPRICLMLSAGRLQRLSDIVFDHTEEYDMGSGLTPTEETTAFPLPPSVPTTELYKVPTRLRHSETRGEMLAETFDETMKHPDCPQLYTRVGDLCLSLFYILKLGWGEAKEFCRVIDGELVSFSNNQDGFISLMKHLREFGLTSDFWIGGRYVNDTESWSWLTGYVMELGSPFWAVRYNDFCVQRVEDMGELTTAYWSNKTACYHYEQAPMPNSTDQCAAVTFRHFYFTTDEDCLAPKSPLCLANRKVSDSQVKQ